MFGWVVCHPHNMSTKNRAIVAPSNISSIFFYNNIFNHYWTLENWDEVGKISVVSNKGS